MKKGFGYIDFAISIGVFVIALILAFVIVRPTIKQENSGSFLLPVLRDGFEKATYWKIERHPFFINSSNENLGTYEVEVPFDFNSNNINLTDKDLNYVPFDYYKDIPLQKDFNITFKAQLPKNLKEPFYLLYSKDFYYNPTTFDSHPGVHPGDFIVISFSNVTHGISEDFFGISVDKFKKLNDYDALKSQFKFPVKNDFAISVYAPVSKEKILSYSRVNPNENAPIYSITYTSFLLYWNTTRIPVLVSLQAW